MKRIFFALAAVAALASCAKEAAPVASLQQSDEIVFQVKDGLSFDVQTRATAVTSLSSFNVVAENSADNSQLWSLQATQSGSNYVTGKYWPSTDGKYAFYASNIALTHAASGATVSPANNDTDVVVAYSAYSSSNYRKVVPLTFDHIYSRIGSVTVETPESYTLKVNSVSTQIVKGGTYSLKNGSWSNKGTAAAQTLAVGNNDVYAVPGDIVVTVNYTLTKGDYTKTFEKSGTISLAQGKVNNITATPSLSTEEGASDIVFTVSLKDWGTQNHSVELK